MRIILNMGYRNSLKKGRRVQMEQDWNARGDLAEAERLKDWLESQQTVLGFWVNRLLEQGDTETLSRLEGHRQGLNQLLRSL